MSSLERRVEGELPPEAVVIRGGEMRVEDLRNSAELYWRKTGGQGYALTVWCWPGHTAEETAQAVGTRRLPHPVLRKCTVGKLRDMGYPLVPSGSRLHYSLMLPSPLARPDLSRLSREFDPPQTNPVAAPRPDPAGR